jgi:dihydrofolate reductase
VTVPIVIVVAAADNGVIGRDNGLVWRLKTDLRRFRGLTLGRPLVMGRKTFESIGKPLPGRETIVLTRDTSFRPAGVAVAHDLAEALALGQEVAARLGSDSVVIGGGDQVYRQALPVTDRIHLTEVHVSPEGDALFPPVDRAVFGETAREDHAAGPDDEHAFSFVDLVRRLPAEAAAS